MDDHNTYTANETANATATTNTINAINNTTNTTNASNHVCINIDEYEPLLGSNETTLEIENRFEKTDESYQNRLPPLLPPVYLTRPPIPPLSTSPLSTVINLQLPLSSSSPAKGCNERTRLLSTESIASYGSTIKTWKKPLKRIDIWFVSFLAFYISYLILGSLLFQNFEYQTELDLRGEFRLSRNEFLQKYPTVSDDDLETFIAEVIKVNGRGVSALRNATSDLNWSFGQALFFSSTVITTIGYGHVTPLTQNGKLFCIVYAMIGIPLTLVLLSAMVERLLIPTNCILGALNSKLGHLYQPFNIRLLHLGVIVTLFVVLFLAIPTAIFTYLEPSWNALDAFYYCFVSLTTIGLGDYIPGDELDQNNRSLYKIGTTCYLIIGLIAMMLTLTVFYDIPQLNLGQLFTESGSDHAEKLRLSLGNTPCYSGPSGLYIPDRDDEVRRSVVRIRPRGDDSPSPDDQTPIHTKDTRVR